MTTLGVRVASLQKVRHVRKRDLKIFLAARCLVGECCRCTADWRFDVESNGMALAVARLEACYVIGLSDLAEELSSGVLS